MKDGNKNINNNFLRLIKTVEKLANEEIQEPGLLKAFDDALGSTLEILNTSFILGRNAEKVNVLKSFWSVLKVVTEMELKKDGEEDGIKKDDTEGKEKITG